jgi:hypothetical protein
MATPQARSIVSPGAAVDVDKIKITAIRLDALFSNFLLQANDNIPLPVPSDRPVLPTSP